MIPATGRVFPALVRIRRVPGWKPALCSRQALSGFCLQMKDPEPTVGSQAARGPRTTTTRRPQNGAE